MNRRAKTVLMLVGLVVALIVGLSAIIETDEEAIERVTNACRLGMLGMLGGDADAILEQVTDDALYIRQKRTKPLVPEVRERVDELRKRIVNISLSVRRIEVDGDDAHATWQVIVGMRPRERIPLVRFDVRVGYRREPSDWKVTRVELSIP